MLTMKDTSLVSGVEQAQTPLIAVKVLRGFFDGYGKACAPGDIVLLLERMARSLIAANKAERAEVSKEPDPVPEPVPEPAQIEEPKTLHDEAVALDTELTD